MRWPRGLGRTQTGRAAPRAAWRTGGPMTTGLFSDALVALGRAAARRHRSLGGRPSADALGRRPLLDGLRRGDLQLRRAGAAATGARHPAARRVRHRDPAGDLRRRGQGPAAAAARHVRVRHLGHPEPGAVLRPRPVRHQAPVLHARRERRPVQVRLRAQGAGRPGRGLGHRPRRAAQVPVVPVRAAAADDDPAVPVAAAGPLPGRRAGGPVDVFRYWRPMLRPEKSPASDTPEQILAVLRDSVNAHLRSDVPLGAFLSGGSTPRRCAPSPPRPARACPRSRPGSRSRGTARSRRPWKRPPPWGCRASRT